jgi:crotonobetainyl-CoA:carnitine CoA-transferase CaiB-like acyl-CoA transferase
MKVGVALVDVLAGTTAAVGILAALRMRDETGVGDRLEIPLLDVALAGLVNVTSSALITNEEPARYGNAHPSVVPYETFRSADGRLAVAAGNDSLFARLCEVLGQPELAADPRFRTNADRVHNRDALVPLLNECFAQRPADDWLAALEASGVPAGKVRGVLDAIHHAEAAGRAATTSVTHPTAGRVELIASPIRLASGLRPAEPPPLLGEHTVPVLEELGYTSAEIAALRQRNVI